ncbi:MAG: glycosyltransferase [Gemmobacter sp.]|nr:glycosyltransferase [Gemmobacter sp.]
MTAALDLTSSRPARFSRAIILTVDRTYLPYALFVIGQIAALHPKRDFDFCIVTTDDLPHHPLIDLHDVRIVRAGLDSVVRAFSVGDRIPVATYFRLFLAGALGGDYARILYLDADIYIRRGDFARLLGAPMGAHPVAGARDPVQFRHKGYVSADMKGLGLGHFPYLSSGVQLIDTARYNALQIGPRAIALATQSPDKMKVLDQTAINAVLQGDFAELPPGWNWLYGFRTIYFTELYDPPILHFAGWRKPWSHLNGEFPERYSRDYRAFFAEHFPDQHAKMPPFTPHGAARLRHLRFFLKHIAGMGVTFAAMEQFKDDFDIKITSPH